ncbi:MAG: SBBP repeat-containing protein [Bryobacterales bacterium]|nr:SBBP repeat-containing protein [Bryobacterales bacterium]
MCLTVFAASAVSAWAAGKSAPSSSPPKSPDLSSVRQRAKQLTGNSSLYFEPNRGQAGKSILAVSRGGGFLTLLSGRETLYLNSNTADPITMQLVGAASPISVEFEQPLRGISNYFYGKDPANWHTDVPHYAKVRFKQVYPGIDLVYYSTEQRMEYDFVVAPGADPRQIQMAWDGVESSQIDKNGDILLRTAAGDIRHKRPVIYQEVGGVRIPVEGRYTAQGEHRFAFTLGEYRRELALVIDPTIFYSTYIGGSQLDDAFALALDAAGNAFVGGSTRSANYPLVSGPPNSQLTGNSDGFITKLSADGQGLFYSTFIGGNIEDAISGVAVDSAGNAYVTGETTSDNFPTTTNPYQKDLRGLVDSFVTKLSPNGNQLVYSTYVGAFDSEDRATVIGVDAAGNAVIAGFTTSFAFPTTDGAVDTSYNGATDIFLTQLNATGQQLVFSTLYGGNSHEIPRALVVDGGGDIYLAGYTQSTDFPTTEGAIQRTQRGIQDAFVARFSQSGKRVVFSTLLGGVGQEVAFGVSIEPGGRILVAGQTTSNDFPTTTGAYQTNMRGVTNAFVSRLNSTASKVIASTLIGTTSLDFASSARSLDAAHVLITGFSSSNSYPTTLDAWQFSGGFAGDGIVSVFTPMLNSLAFSSVLGGSAEDIVKVSASAPGGDVVFAGTTGGGLTVTGEAYDQTFNGLSDVFVTRATGFNYVECVSTATPAGTTFPSQGGGSGIGVAGSFCPWYAFSSTPWVALTSNALSQGPGSLNFTLADNASAGPRTALVHVAGNQVHLLQKGTSTVPPFSDVPNSDAFVDYVRIMKSNAITSGCDAVNYCPTQNTTRGQMAVFIVRSLLGSDDFQFPAAPYFTDVPATHPFYKWIQKLRQIGVTQGCNLTQYCPNDSVTRGQMAAFLIRAKYGNNFQYNLTQSFTDVPASHTFFSHIQKLRQTGVTLGCTATAFCVNDPTTRAQMAAFLTRMFLTPW